MATPGTSQPFRLPIDPAIRPGLAGETQLTVAAEHLAPHTPKFSTPAMVMLMEQASYRAVLRLLHPNQTVVGYEVNVKHLAPADAGALVTARSILTDVSGNKLRFEVEAYCGDLLLGTAEHRMAIVTRERAGG